MDRISNLPDEIICHIVSFLSAKEAAFATTLARRWGNLFKIIPKLLFDDSMPKAEGSFEEFLNAVMAIPVTDRVRSFSLACKHVGLPEHNDDHLNRRIRSIRRLPRYEDRIRRCLRHVVVKRGVVALKIELADAVYYSLPVEVFTCKTVSTMRLGSCVIHALPGDVFLPSLKSLYLDSVRFYASDGRCSFQTLLSASPVLEELVIHGVDWELWSWSCTVSSLTLRRLTIRRTNWRHVYEGQYGIGISFDTPALTYFYFSDIVRSRYPLVNLNSVVEATIFLKVGFGERWYNQIAKVINPMNLVKGITNAEILVLDSQSIDMFYVFRKVLPVFEKVHQLSVRFDGECWNRLPNLIEKCPNLESLIIRDSLHTGSKEDGFICPCVLEYSFLSPVKNLVIERYGGTMKELKQIKLLLEKTSSLMMLQIKAEVPPLKEARLLADIVLLPRASTYCLFQVTGNWTDLIALSYRELEMCHDRHGGIRRSGDKDQCAL